MQRNAGLTEEFVEEQRARLESLREQIVRRDRRVESEQRQLRDQDLAIVQDEAEAGSSEAQRQIDESIYATSGRRLEDVDRALAKIDEGTYGLSDESGDPIPKERLRVLPEAVRTVEEEELEERRRAR